MTTADRDAILDLILDAADAIEGDRHHAIREAVHAFCKAFPAEADAYATQVARDYASRDQDCPPCPWPASPPPSRAVDEPICVPF